MNFRIAVDTGGTFSDVAVSERGGSFWVDKAPTTPGRVFDGISTALEHTASDHDLSLEDLLASTSVFIYGTTHALNAIVTGRTARTAFLTTAGHPDVLMFREGGKTNPFDFRNSYPPPYVPRRLTFEIPERILSDGTVESGLDEDAVREVLAAVRAENVEAIAVSLLWSIVNPVHELRLGELIEAELPGIPFTLSSQLNPILREYRRASSASIDASLKPLMQRHLGEIAVDLTDRGFAGELLVVSSFGGVLGVEDVVRRPIYSVNSGPAMAPVAGRYYADEADSVIVCDMGGTTFDVSLVRDGYLTYTRETWLGPRFVGHMTGLSSVDVRSIGAGGGSIAWIDSGGLLRVGPQSAGAVPGPVAYRQGGEEPTVTDAAVALGHLDPDYFLGGRMTLDREAATTAIRERVAEPLGLSMEEAAWAILVVANENMVSAIREITINEGLDPRDSMVVAGGGAGGMTIAQIASILGCDRVVIPRTAPALSACGAQLSDMVTEFSASSRADTNRFPFDSANEALEGLDAEMDEFFDRLGVDPEDRQKEFFVEARYPYQVWELETPLPTARFSGDGDVQALVEEFHRVHDRVFAVKDPGSHVECIYWKGRATAVIEKPEPRVASEAATDIAERRRSCWFGDGWVETRCYEAGEITAADGPIPGPVVIDEPTTTVVVQPGWTVQVDDMGDYLMTKESDR